MATGMMWSTSSSDLAPHIWQANPSLASTWALRLVQFPGRLRFLADVFCQGFRVWCFRHRPSRTVLVMHPLAKQTEGALGMRGSPPKSCRLVPGKVPPGGSRSSLWPRLDSGLAAGALRLPGPHQGPGKGPRQLKPWPSNQQGNQQEGNLYKFFLL